MKVEPRRALLRGLPALLALFVAPFVPAAVPGIVFFGLIGTALSLLDIVLARHGLVNGRIAALALAGATLYAAATFQAIYAYGVIDTGTLQGGLAAVAEWCQTLLGRDGPQAPANWTVMLYLVSCAGGGHAATIVATSPPPRNWRSERVDAAIVILFVALPLGACIAFVSEGLGVLPIVSAMAIGMVAMLTTLVTYALLIGVTLTCDWIERALWHPARPDGSSLPEPSSHPLP